MNDPMKAPESAMGKALRDEAKKDFSPNMIRAALNNAADEIDRQAIIIASYPANEAEYNRVVKKLGETESLLNRRETTFQKERTENRQLRLAVDKQTAPVADMGEMLPVFLRALTGASKGLSVDTMAEKLLEVKDVSGIAKVLGELIESAVEEEKVEPGRIERKGFLHCPHDGLKCTHECEGDECWRELDGS